MISVIGTTGKYSLQPSAVEMHRESLTWLSSAELWKHEINFFQKLLDKHAPTGSSIDFKKQVDHYQHLITFYGGELVPELIKMVRTHENKLAGMLQTLDETEVSYFSEHDGIMTKLSSFEKVYTDFKHGIIKFIEKGLVRIKN
jgi:hypothetical protein